MTKKIVARECRFATHLQSWHPDVQDLHLIKERVHYDDGTNGPRVVFLPDFKRKFWVTKPEYRNHKEKKEWEKIERVQEYTCTQSELRDRVALALDKPWAKREYLRKLANSPYLYGADITTTTLIKHAYLAKYPDAVTAYSTAYFDTETDMVHGHKRIVMATIAFGNMVVTAICKDFLEGIANAEDRIAAAMDKYLAPVVARRNLQCTTLIVNSEIDIIKATFKYAHEWKPDFLSIWNIDFDMPKMLLACERAGVDPRDIFCDPIVPRDRRYFKYKTGPRKKVTASGKFKPIGFADQWHTVICPSSFYFIDGMCTYRQTRGGQELSSYRLDHILKINELDGKLDFEEANGHEEAKWHTFMQTYHKIEYIIYNRYDTIGMMELEEKVLDLSFTLAGQCEHSDFAKFSSQPKRLADDLYFECLEKNHVVGTVGQPEDGKFVPDADMDGIPAEEDEEDHKDLGLKDWILCLAAHNTANMGLRCIEEDPTIVTNYRVAVFDSDAVSSYPSDTAAANVSKETNLRDLISISGVEEHVFKMQNINFLSGKVNAIEYVTTMFDAPKPPEMLKLYQDYKRTINA